MIANLLTIFAPSTSVSILGSKIIKSFYLIQLKNIKNPKKTNGNQENFVKENYIKENYLKETLVEGNYIK